MRRFSWEKAREGCRFRLSTLFPNSPAVVVVKILCSIASLALVIGGLGSVKRFFVPNGNAIEKVEQEQGGGKFGRAQAPVYPRMKNAHNRLCLSKQKSRPSAPR